MKKIMPSAIAVSSEPRIRGRKAKLQEMLDNELIEASKEKERFLAMGKITKALDSGAHIEAKDKEGMTALMHVSKNLNDHAGIVLVSRGADRTKRDNSGKDALDHLRESEKYDEDGVYPPPGSVLKAVLQNGLENFNPAWFA